MPLNTLYISYNTKEIRVAYKSKYIKHENQVVLLMITDGKKCFFVKKLFVLFREITSKHDGDFHCLNCCHSCSTKNKLKKHKMYANIMNIAM